MTLYIPPVVGRNWMPSNFQLRAPFPSIAGDADPEPILGINAASAGPMRRSGKAAEERTVIMGPSFWAGSQNVRVNVAPACSTISSPGCAALRAPCRFPPAFTYRVAAYAGDAASRTVARRATVGAAPADTR